MVVPPAYAYVLDPPIADGVPPQEKNSLRLPPVLSKFPQRSWCYPSYSGRERKRTLLFGWDFMLQTVSTIGWDVDAMEVA